MSETTVETHAVVQPMLLRPEQVAVALNISRATVYRLMAAGVIPSVQVGGSRRTTRSQLDRYLAKLESE